MFLHNLAVVSACICNNNKSFMETTKMKIEYRKLTDNESDPWQMLTNLDELIWNGVYALRVIDDDGSLGLPFRFGNDDTVTLVLKDHSHDGKLQSSRTIVQTITRVESYTGKVFVYNRTRYCNGGIHRWNSWERATEENGNPTIDSTFIQQIEQNSVNISNERDRAKRIEKQLETDIAANTQAIANEISRAQESEKYIKAGLRCNILQINTGALQENDDPYPGTTYSAYSDLVTGNGEIVVADEYYIDSIKIFSKDGTEWGYISNYNNRSYAFDDGFKYQFGFAKKDNNRFTSNELGTIVQSLTFNPIVWSGSKNMDSYDCSGVYPISGKRESTTDNMPFSSTGIINARLTVIRAGSCVTQLLVMLNAGDGDGNIYMRTNKNGKWQDWKKQQKCTEVGSIGFGQSRTFDDLIDSGVYSGVNVFLINDASSGIPTVANETFMLVVINADLAGAGVSQLKYALLLDGTVNIAKRVRHNGIWGEWGSIIDVADQVESLRRATPELNRYELFSIGGSLSSAGMWQAKVAELNGYRFDRNKNSKPGMVLSAGNSGNSGKTFDNILWRARNLIEQNCISGDGENAIVVLENINDAYSVFDNEVRPINPAEPIDGYSYSEFNVELLESIVDKAEVNAVLRLEKISGGYNLKVDSLPAKEGNICLRIGYTDGESRDYYIHLTPQTDNVETLQHVLACILECGYHDVTAVLADDASSVDFSSDEPINLQYVEFVDVEDTGMACVITDNPNVKSHVAMYFIGDSIAEWSDIDKWQEGITYSQGWKSAIELLIRRYPKLHLCVGLFPVYAVGSTDYLLSNGCYDTEAYNNSETMVVLVKMESELKKIAEYYSLPFINVFRECGISVSNMSSFYYAASGGLPKSCWYERVGETVAAHLKRFLA